MTLLRTANQFSSISAASLKSRRWYLLLAGRKLRGSSLFYYVWASLMRPSIVEAPAFTADRRGRGAETESEAAVRRTASHNWSHKNQLYK